MKKILATFVLILSFGASAQQLQRCIDPVTGLGYAAINCNAQAVSPSGGSSSGAINCCVKILGGGMCKYHAPTGANNQCPGGFPVPIVHPSCPTSSDPRPCNH